MSKSNGFGLLAGPFAGRNGCGSRVLHVFLPSDFRAHVDALGTCLIYRDLLVRWRTYVFLILRAVNKV